MGYPNPEAELAALKVQNEEHKRLHAAAVQEAADWKRCVEDMQAELDRKQEQVTALLLFVSHVKIMKASIVRDYAHRYTDD